MPLCLLATALRHSKVAEQLDAGTVCINDGLVNYIIPDTPMGGVKDSGFSRRHGAEGIRKFCHQKTSSSTGLA